MTRAEVEKVISDVIRMKEETGIDYPVRIRVAEKTFNGFRIVSNRPDRITGIPYEGAWLDPNSDLRKKGKIIYILKAKIKDISSPYFPKPNGSGLDLSNFPSIK